MSIRIATVPRRLAVLALFAVAVPCLNAQEIPVAAGQTFDVDASLVSLPSYSAKPKLSCTFNNVVSSKLQKASAKLWTYTAGGSTATFLWTKKIKLYNKANFIQMQKNGVSIVGWLGSGFQADQYMTGTMASTELDPPVFVANPIVLRAPRVDAVLENTPSVGQYAIRGMWFGTKKPKVWIEYVSNNDSASVKRLKCKVLPPSSYLDANGKLAYMSAATGDSEAIITMPGGAHPRDLLTYSGIIVVENGVGMHYGTYPP
jgi:hypothetical protein